MLNFWKGIVKLSPDNDTWVNTVKVEPNVFQIEGNFAEVTRMLKEDLVVLIHKQV